MKRNKVLVVTVVLIFLTGVLTVFGAGSREMSDSNSESEVFEQMLERAEAIVNYEWTPTQRIAVVE